MNSRSMIKTPLHACAQARWRILFIKNILRPNGPQAEEELAKAEAALAKVQAAINDALLPTAATSKAPLLVQESTAQGRLRAS